MNTLLQILVTLAISFVLILWILKINNIARPIMWFFSFNDRRAYNTVMKDIPVLSYKILTFDSCNSCYDCKYSDYNIMIWENEDAGIKRIGIFESKGKKRCVFASNTYPDKGNALYDYIMANCDNGRDEDIKVIESEDTKYIVNTAVRIV